MKKILIYLGSILSVGIAFYAFMNYVLVIPGTTFDEQKITYAKHVISITLHAGFGGLALLTGGIQMITAWRIKFPKANIILRKIYYFSVGISSTVGLYVATYAAGGFSNKVGFTMLGCLWLGSLIMTILADYKGNMELFRIWIIRNFALTFAAVTLRLYIPIFGIFMGFDTNSMSVIYSIMGFVCWIPNIILVEWYLFSKTLTKNT